MNRLSPLILTLALILLLAACGEEAPIPTIAPQATVPADTPLPADDPEPAETETLVSAPEPTATPSPAPEPTETASPEPAASQLALEALANLEYQSEFTESGTAPLVDGEYREPAAPGSASEIRVMLTEYVAFGELNGEPTAAVILVSDSGGSGTFYDLAVVVEQDGEPVNVATTLLGDRVRINDLTIEDGQIVVDLVTQGPDDPFCCPTQQMVNTYELQGDQLVLASSEIVGTVEAPPTATTSADSAAAATAEAEADSGGADTETSFFPDAIQMDLQELADSFEWEVVDASPIPPGPGGMGFPRHIVLGFDGEDPLETPVTERRVMYLFPVDAYINLYAASGNDRVGAQVQRLQELIDGADGRQGSPTGTMPLLPPPNSLMDRWVGFADLDFNDGRGISYISDSPFRQSIGVWTNEGTGYYYQGLTEDGRFYVSLWWPVSTTSLPDTAGDASPEVAEQASASRESYDAYMLETKNALNALGPADWTPDLSMLDAMMASLTFQYD
jgi:hypothetical protein